MKIFDTRSMLILKLFGSLLGDSMRKIRLNKIKQISVIPMIAILVTGVMPAFAGPVIIDGTDSPDHGQNWPYVQNAAKSLLEQQTRPGPHTVDIMSFGTDDNNSGGGGVINLAANNLGVTVEHCPEPVGIQNCFDNITNNTKNPKMLYFPGTGSPNVLSFSEGVTLQNNAQLISDFVASGGGVLSHGSGDTALGWLGVILPGLEYPGGCQSSGAELTPIGQELFPDITNQNISGICHNTFTGNFGGLVVLGLDGQNKPFILGLQGGQGGNIEEGIDSTGGNGGMNHWDKRPTFGIDHETRGNQIVENGFSFNGDYFTVTDNHHTDFAEQSVEIGIPNTFSATVYADKKLKVQEFLFGIPNIGESHLAEMGIEVWYDRNGNIEDVVVDQDTEVIDEGTISVSHEKTKCLSTDTEPLCDTTTVSMTFLEPLAEKVMAIKAIDYELRDQRTYLNDGFDISGESLNPMKSKMIPSNIKNQGLTEVTQLAKYSPYWKSDDGRMFEMNSFGSFKEINQSFERFTDMGDAKTRLHSGFGEILQYEQDRATQVFDATKLISDSPDSFGYHFDMTERFNEEMMQKIYEQQEIAKEILKEMDKQNRHY